MTAYNPDELRCFVVVREDIEIPKGKFGGQIAHGVKFSWVSCHDRDPQRAWDYLRSPYQGVIVGRVKTLADLLALRDKVAAFGLPHGLVEDQARTHFTEPTVTCLGIGPLTEAERLLQPIKRIQIWKHEAPGLDPLLALLARALPVLRGAGDEALVADVLTALKAHGRDV